MIAQVKKNEISIDFSIIAEFCKAAASIKDASFVYLRYFNEVVDLYTEGLSATAYVTLPPSNTELDSFSAGFSREQFLAIFKKMYDGQVVFKFKKASVEISLDNIKAKLKIVSPKSRSKAPELLSIIDDELIVKEITNKMAHATLVDEAKKELDKKFAGVLFDNSDCLRICKFTARSLFLSTIPAIFQIPYRVVVSDDFAKAIRSFRKDVKSYAFTRNHSVILLKNGTTVYFALMQDSYPLEYLDMWGFNKGLSLVPDSANLYRFSRDSIIGAVDLVGTALGDTEHWVSLAPIGTVGDDFVWRISGKSHTGMEIQEDIISSGSELLDKFQVQKKTLLSLLGMFEEYVTLGDFNSTFVSLSNEDGSIISILLKSAR